MVCLEFRHRDEQIGLHHRLRKIKLAETRVVAAQGNRPDIVAIEVDVSSARVAQDRLQSRRRQHVLRIPVVSGPLGDDHVPCAFSAEGLDGHREVSGGAVGNPGVHPDRRIEQWIGRGHDGSHRATGGEPSDVDASRINDEIAHDRAGSGIPRRQVRDTAPAP